MPVIVAYDATRWDDYREEETDVVALKSPYELKDAIRSALQAARKEHDVFVGTWDPQKRFWWCFPWAWESVRTALEDEGVEYDDDAVAELFAPRTEKKPPKKEPPPPRPATKQPHEVLGVAITAGESETKAAYLRLTKQWHPDRLPLDLAPELRQFANTRMAEINVAYDVFKKRFAQAGSTV